MGDRRTLHKILFWVLVFLFMKYVVYSTSYIGRDSDRVMYYVCKNNTEVAELLGYESEGFDLSVFTTAAKKAEEVRDEKDTKYYIVMINEDDSFIVCYREKEYDIFFYSWQ